MDVLRQDFSTVSCFCLFVGYPRSGHSIVGSIVDAHPNMILGDEVGVQLLAVEGCDQQVIFERIKKRSERGPHYRIPSPWVGKAERLEVVGAKPSPPLAWREGVQPAVSRDPNVLKALREAIKVPIRLVHVVRNPYDNIAGLVVNGWAEGLREGIALYFDTFDRNMEIKEEMSAPWLDIRLEDDLVARPGETITGLCRFLGQPAPKEYLEACVAAVWPEPRFRRRDVEWTEDLVELVAVGVSEREAFAP